MRVGLIAGIHGKLAALDAVLTDLARVPLDVERRLAAGRVSGMPHADWCASKWQAPSGDA